MDTFSADAHVIETPAKPPAGRQSVAPGRWWDSAASAMSADQSAPSTTAFNAQAAPKGAWGKPLSPEPASMMAKATAAATEMKNVLVSALLRNVGYNHLCESQRHVDQRTTVAVPVESICNGAHGPNVSAANCEKLHFKGELPQYVTVHVAANRIIGTETAANARYDYLEYGSLWPLCTDATHKTVDDAAACTKGVHLRGPTGVEAAKRSVALLVPADALAPTTATERIRKDAAAFANLCNFPGCNRGNACGWIHLKDGCQIADAPQPQPQSQSQKKDTTAAPGFVVHDDFEEAPATPPQVAATLPPPTAPLSNAPIGARRSALLRRRREVPVAQRAEFDEGMLGACTAPIPEPENVWPNLQNAIAGFFDAVEEQGVVDNADTNDAAPRSVVVKDANGRGVVRGMAGAVERDARGNITSASFNVPAVCPHLGGFPTNSTSGGGGGVAPAACVSLANVGPPPRGFLSHAANTIADVFNADVASVELEGDTAGCSADGVGPKLSADAEEVQDSIDGGYGAVFPRFASLRLGLVRRAEGRAGGSRLDREVFVQVHLHPWNRALPA